MMRYSDPPSLAAAALLAAPAGARTTATTLEANVGPGFTISLRDASGAGVSHLDPGRRTRSTSSTSRTCTTSTSRGPGVDKSTDVPGTGEQTWDVTLTDGKYTYICDAHATTMKGSFTVGTVAAPPAVTQKLSGSVGPGAKITFARSAKAGKAVLTIRDRSATDNFHLDRARREQEDGRPFKGTVTWTVTLRAGAYTFRSDAHTKLKGTMSVS